MGALARQLQAAGSEALARQLQAPGSWLSSCDAWALLLGSVWDLPGPGIEPVPPALAGMNVAFVYGFIGIHGFHEARAEGFTFPVYPYLF